MPTVTMTMDELLELVAERGNRGALEALADISTGTGPRTRVVRKRKGKAAKGMGRAMKEANKKLRTKSGKLRKGKTQADVARLAHKIRRQKYA